MEDVNLYVLIARSCDACGGEVKIQILDRVPTLEEKENIIRHMGICAEFYLIENLVINGESTRKYPGEIKSWRI